VEDFALAQPKPELPKLPRNFRPLGWELFLGFVLVVLANMTVACFLLPHGGSSTSWSARGSARCSSRSTSPPSWRRGNLREVLFDLYNEYEQRQGEPGA
jgi:hypothetical protein